MKKVIILLLTAVFLISCEDSQTPITITTSYTLDESFDLEIGQIAGTQATYTETNTQDLSQLITNYNDVDGVSLNTLTYEITNFSGDTSGMVESGTISVNNIVIATISNLNPSQASTNTTIFEINDPSIVSQIENILETTPVLNLEATVTIPSSAPMTFSIEIHLGVDVTFN